MWKDILKEWPPKYDPCYAPSSKSRYWNKELETMDPRERERKVILPKLQAQLKYAYEKSPFYKKKWDEARVKPEPTHRDSTSATTLRRTWE